MKEGKSRKYKSKSKLIDTLDLTEETRATKSSKYAKNSEELKMKLKKSV